MLRDLQNAKPKFEAIKQQQQIACDRGPDDGCGGFGLDWCVLVSPSTRLLGYMKMYLDVGELGPRRGTAMTPWRGLEAVDILGSLIVNDCVIDSKSRLNWRTVGSVRVGVKR